MKKNETLKVVVAGSAKFDDRAFVFGVLDAFCKNSNVDLEIFSGDFTGVSQFAKEWAFLKSMKYETHHFFSQEHTNPFFEDVDLPKEIISADKYYENGKNFLLEKGIKVLITMPNKEGQIGVQTANIKRMAESAGIAVLDASELYELIIKARQEDLQIKEELGRQGLKGKTPESKTSVVQNLASLGKI